MKKSLLTIFGFFIMLFAMGAVYGLTDVTLQHPSASAYINGTGDELINITFTNAEQLTISCQLQITSASTANSTGYDLFNITNATSADTLNQTNTTFNFSKYMFEDASNYVFKVSCQNDTHQVNDTNTGITIDYTNPTAPTLTSPSATSKVKNSETVTWAVTGSEVTACTYYIGTQSFTGTHSGNTCTYTYSTRDVPGGTYQTYMAATDGTNTTNSNWEYFTFDNGDSTGGLGITAIKKTDAGKLGVNTGDIDMQKLIIVGLIIFGLYYFYNKK